MMNTGDYRRLRELFDRLSPLDAAERARAMDSSLPPGDPIRDELEKLLALSPAEPELPQPPGAAAIPPDAVLSGRYRIQRLLGVGGFGRTYLAADRQLHDKPVVVKQPLPVAAPRNREWFARHYTDEIRALAALDHPNIVAVLDSGDDPTHGPYFVLQFIDGPTLARLISKERLELDRVERLLEGIAQALAAAHARGIIHRDLKPDNILIRGAGTPEETPVLIDFGIASLTGGPGETPNTTRVVGSPNYWAPEQLWGKVLPQSDIYALGCIAVELLTGELLHKHVPKASSTEAAAAQILADHRPDLALETRQAIARLVTLDHEQRPADARGIRLLRAGAQPPVVEIPESSTRRGWMGLAVGGVALTGVVWLASRQMKTLNAPGPTLRLAVRAIRANAQSNGPFDWNRDRVTQSDRLRLELTATPAAFVYLLAQSQGSLALLYPLRTGEPRHDTVRVPTTESDWIEFDNQPERVQFLFIVSADLLPEAEAAVKAAASAGGVVPASERDRLLERLKASSTTALTPRPESTTWEAQGSDSLLVAEVYLEHVAR